MSESFQSVESFSGHMPQGKGKGIVLLAGLALIKISALLAMRHNCRIDHMVKFWQRAATSRLRLSLRF
ncbi:hypothetical protein [Thermopetrobacter sp. TC1]|uniref:hypothetical protein n=1 Tax=Thermopetrobacter sp. TC1 TaxID=1495045 RepID=UPI0012E031C7|nr:hypothetical protein [Thermopetrobacter sp. TC1]